MPVQPRTAYQTSVRARLSGNAAHWRAITALQRAGWGDLGHSMTRVDSLGQVHDLTGFQAYCSINNNNLAAGNAAVTDAPSLVTPDSLLTATLTLTVSAFSVAYTPTPMGAGERVMCFVSLMRSQGVTFQRDLRLLVVSAAAAASPLDIFTAYSSRFGTPVSGRRIFVGLVRYSLGFESGRLVASAVVT
jgi:hypothetical protein